MEDKTTKTKIDEKNMATHRKGVKQLMQAVKEKQKNKSPLVKDPGIRAIIGAAGNEPKKGKEPKKGMFTDFGADKFGTTAYEVPTEENMNRPKATRPDDDLNKKMREDYKPFKKGGSVKSSASKRADGIAMKGKTRGRMM